MCVYAAYAPHQSWPTLGILLGVILLASCGQDRPPNSGPATEVAKTETWTERRCLSEARETARLACEGDGVSSDCRAPRLVETQFGNCAREYPTSTYVFAFGADNPTARLGVDWMGCANHYCLMVHGIRLLVPGNRVRDNKMQARSIAVSMAHALWAPQEDAPGSAKDRATLHSRKCPPSFDGASSLGIDAFELCVDHQDKDLGYARVRLRRTKLGPVATDVHWDGIM
jgi:hypothetical protein